MCNYSLIMFISFVFILSFPVSYITYIIYNKIKDDVKIKSNFIKNFIIPITLFTVIMITVINLLSIQTTINKTTFDYKIEKVNCTNMCLLVKNDKNEYTIKNISIDRTTFKKSDKNQLSVITCKSYFNGLSLFNENYKSCIERGYHEGKNYILYVKNLNFMDDK